eukprot:scaffold185882_cov28-Tisochrysis_lutea.AAC.1
MSIEDGAVLARADARPTLPNCPSLGIFEHPGCRLAAGVFSPAGTKYASYLVSELVRDLNGPFETKPSEGLVPDAGLAVLPCRSWAAWRQELASRGCVGWREKPSSSSQCAPAWSRDEDGKVIPRHDCSLVSLSGCMAVVRSRSGDAGSLLLSSPAVRAVLSAASLSELVDCGEWSAGELAGVVWPREALREARCCRERRSECTSCTSSSSSAGLVGVCRESSSAMCLGKAS